MWLLLAACTSQEIPLLRVPHALLPGESGPPRNLLMLSIDTLRRDHVDPYATDGVERTDFLNRLISEGIHLSDHQQCSNWTFHSTSCTQLGRQVEEIGWVAKLTGDGPTPLPDGQQTLAARLSEAGFRTLISSRIKWMSADWNNIQGYEQNLAQAGGALGLANDGIDGLARSLAEEPAERWFLHIHLTEPHPTYSPPEEYLSALAELPSIPWDLDDAEMHYALTEDLWSGLTEEERALLEQHMRARYTGEVRWTDDLLEQIWDRLEREGWLEDTLVVIWNDHGEQFWEHGNQTHAYGLNAEENDGILLFWSEDLEPMEWTGPTHAIDLVPTVLDALGLPVPDDGSLPGYVLGTAPDDRARFTSAAARLGPLAAVTKNGKKLVFQFDGTVQLWDRGADRAERVPLTLEGDPDVLELWQLLAPRVELLSEAIPEIPVAWP